MACTQSQEHHFSIARHIWFCPSEERIKKALYDLPKTEREQVWADMTGSRQATDFRMHAESSRLAQDSTNAMKRILSSLLLDCSGRNQEDLLAINLALQKSPTYVNGQILKFLRADDFNPRLAAKRLVSFFDLKLSLFGPDLLTSDICMDDLSEADMESLAGGGIQLLPSNDHASRGVIYSRASNNVYKDRNNMLRAYFYVLQSATNIERFQKVGFVSVSYQVGEYPTSGYDFELDRRISNLVKVFPIRFAAIYMCYSSQPWRQVADLMSHMLTPMLRVRLRSIPGSHLECLHKLKALGIPHHAIPAGGGQGDLSNHLNWLEARRAEEMNL